MNESLLERVPASRRVAKMNTAQIELCAAGLLNDRDRLFDMLEKMRPMKLRFYKQVYHVKSVSTAVR
jgi:hypothetical protein